jgi:hypothetical protein
VAKSSSAKWEIMTLGIPDPQVDNATLQGWARAGRLKPNTLVKELSTGATFPANQVPGVFSDKSWTTAIILFLFPGGLGVDRF